MSEAKHTPAPWHYQEGSDKYTHIVRTGEISRDNPHSGRHFLCQLSQRGDGESEANARLISAAPDLLEALKGILKTQERWGLTSVRNAAYNAAVDAIAKAEGRSMPSPQGTKP